MRAFIVGNGPSLRNTNLELLRDEVSYATNAIHLLYNQTPWRPNHIVIGDVTAKHRDWAYEGGITPDKRIGRFLDIIYANAGAQIHIRGNYRVWAKRIVGILPVDFFDVCTHHSLGVGESIEDKAPVEWHLPQVCRWGGSVLMAIQLAAHAGHEPLYLVGCDLGYTKGTDNHFVPDYDEPIGRAKAKALNAVIGNAHALASVSWEIYNASIGGHLENYPRVSFGELF